MNVFKKNEAPRASPWYPGGAVAPAGAPVERNPAPKTTIHPRASPWSSGAVDKEKEGFSSVLIIIFGAIILAAGIFYFLKSSSRTTANKNVPAQAAPSQIAPSQTGAPSFLQSKPSEQPVSSTQPQPVPAAPQSAGADSLYKGKIKISYASGYSSDPRYEYIVVENETAGENISITGFSFLNSSGGTLVLPSGQDLPGLNGGVDGPIVLKPQDRATITVGRQEKRINFRENLCTGYFDEFSDFIPSLSHNCPRPDTKNLIYLSDYCLNIIDSTYTCRLPDFSRVSAGDSACSDYLNSNLNYAGCVRNYRSRPDFYSREWKIWLQQDEEFLRSTHEKLTLRDASGKFVDEYSY